MSKKSHHASPYAPKAIQGSGAFPSDAQVTTARQREIPDPASALADIASVHQPSERARFRAATASQDQREARARREAQQIVAAAERPAPTVHEDLQAVRRRPLDAPMATPITKLPQEPAPMICGLSDIPDPIATCAWDAITDSWSEPVRGWWARWQFSVAFAIWSIGCFLLGKLA